MEILRRRGFHRWWIRFVFSAVGISLWRFLPPWISPLTDPLRFSAVGVPPWRSLPPWILPLADLLQILLNRAMIQIELRS